MSVGVRDLLAVAVFCAGSGCAGNGVRPAAAAEGRSVDLSSSLAGIAALAKALAYDASRGQDATRCVVYTLTSVAADTIAQASSDPSVRPGAEIDLSVCAVRLSDLSCDQGKAVSATLQWTFAIGAELINEALAADGKLRWDPVLVDTCPVLTGEALSNAG